MIGLMLLDLLDAYEDRVQRLFPISAIRYRECFTWTGNLHRRLGAFHSFVMGWNQNKHKNVIFMTH